MKLKTKWNIGKHKEPIESEEQWKLRRSFMKKHKLLYSEDRLVTLTKVFINMEFLGAIYNQKLMSEVNELANQVDEIVKFREEKSNKIKKVFISASEAAKLKNVPIKIHSKTETESNSNLNNKRTHLEETNTSKMKQDCSPCKKKKVVQINKEKQIKSPKKSTIKQKKCNNSEENEIELNNESETKLSKSDLIYKSFLNSLTSNNIITNDATMETNKNKQTTKSNNKSLIKQKNCNNWEEKTNVLELINEPETELSNVDWTYRRFLNSLAPINKKEKSVVTMENNKQTKLKIDNWLVEDSDVKITYTFSNVSNKPKVEFQPKPEETNKKNETNNNNSDICAIKNIIRSRVNKNNKIKRRLNKLQKKGVITSKDRKKLKHAEESKIYLNDNIDKMDSLKFRTEANRELYKKVREQNGIGSSFVLIATEEQFDNKNYKEILENSIQEARMTCEFKEEENELKFLINDEVYKSIQIDNEDKSQMQVKLSAKVFKELEEYCFIVLRKPEYFYAQTVTKKEVFNEEDLEEEEEVEKTTGPPPENVYSGFGEKMMKMMGWSGKGLGKNETGIESHIEAKKIAQFDGIKRKTGKAAQNERQKMKKAMDFMSNYATGGSTTRFLKFFGGFTKLERSYLHKSAFRFKLNSKSYGAGKNRFMIVEKFVSIWDEIVEALNSYGETNSIILFNPKHPDLYK